MEVFYMDETLIEKCSILLPQEIVAAMKEGEPYSALLLVDKEEAVGAIAGKIADNELLIESIYVEESSRGKGGGRLLLDSLLSGCRGLCYGVKVCFSAVNEDMEKMAGFFGAMGFREKDGGYDQVYMADLKDLEKSSFVKVKGKGTSFSDVNSRILRNLSSDALRNGWPLPRHGLFSEFVDNELSMVRMEDDKVKAYAVVEHLSGYLSLSALKCGEKAGMELASLLAAVWNRAAEKEGKDQKLIVHTINKASYRIANTLLPNAKQISHTLEREIF